MSEENVALVRRGFELFARRDYPKMMPLFAEDAEWYPYLGLVGGEVHRGRAAIERLFRDIDDYMEFTLEPEEFVDLGGVVMVPLRARGTGVESGAGVVASWAQLWWVRDGKAVRVESYPDRETALEAARSRQG